MDKKALLSLSCGMYVVGCSLNGKRNALIANTVFQLASKQPLVGVSISKDVFSHEVIAKSGYFSVSVLDSDAPMDFIKRLGFDSGIASDKTLGLCTAELSGVIVFLDHACACLAAKVIKLVDCQTHTLFIGEVLDAKLLTDGKALTYTAYRDNKGATPRFSPTFNVEPLQPLGKG
jgi:ferric-chelate reductase [NAD(P)H]